MTTVPEFFKRDTRRSDDAWDDWEAVRVFIAEEAVCRIAVNTEEFPFVAAVSYEFDGDAFILNFSRKGRLAEAVLREPRCTISIDQPMREYQDELAHNANAEYHSVVSRCTIELTELDLPPVEGERRARQIYSARAKILSLSANKRVLDESGDL